jgi:aminomethyltransferase
VLPSQTSIEFSAWPALNSNFYRNSRRQAVSDAATRLETPLHAAHVAAGARMVDFFGWQMPVQYTGVIDEHVAVRTRAGLFDVSHMGEVSVRGPQALDFLQKLTCNDVSRVRVGRAQYNALTTPNGAFVDDLLVYRLADRDYLLVVNASNTAKDLAWLEEHKGGFDLDLRDVTPEYAQLALQGPNAQEILSGLVDEDLSKIRYYAFIRTDVNGVEAILSRTGYTGEDGFELYVPAQGAEELWYALLGAGAPLGLVPVGLGARDTLRLEAKMTLYGNDIDDTTTVLEADLGWIVKLKKGEFIGSEVLARQSEEGIERKLVGFEMKGRGIARHGYRARIGDREVGPVTSGSHAPFLKKSIGLVYLPVEMSEPGNEFEVEVRGRWEPAAVVPTPFYRRER